MQRPSSIVRAEGTACMGDDASRRQTRDTAMQRARDQAARLVRSHISSSVTVRDNVLREDLIRSYARADVRVLEVLESAWHQDPTAGQCYRTRILAEVVPEASGKNLHGSLPEDPAAPLTIRLWTDKDSYRSGEVVRVYLKGNKPFYALLAYKDVAGRLIQLLPNPMRHANRFQGGVVYRVPDLEDGFDLKVIPPYGREKVMLFAGTGPLGTVRTTKNSGILVIDETPEDLARSTRSIRLVPARPEQGADAVRRSQEPVEFYETSLDISTEP